jgi:protocatechuate 3,4-dioxygenase beta subunit
MERKDFLKNSLGLLGASLIVPKVLVSCSESKTISQGDCKVWAAETEGPFPTKKPEEFLTKNIKGDRKGVEATIKINLKNIDDNCKPLKDAIIDIWHCDKDGDYSQYGAMMMQPTDYKSYKFLRGRQITNANGDVEFNSIFPGWYQGRATHIHVHIYDKNGKSLKVTQIAFPEGDDSVVATVNAAKNYGYTKGLEGYTYNAKDMVFEDDKEGTQISNVTGSLDKGYIIQANIIVSTENIEVFDDKMGGPGGPGMPPDGMPPMESKFSFDVTEPTKVNVKVYNPKGDLIKTVLDKEFQKGKHDLDFSTFGLSSGPYSYILSKVTAKDSVVESNLFFIK